MKYVPTIIIIVFLSWHLQSQEISFYPDIGVQLGTGNTIDSKPNQTRYRNGGEAFDVAVDNTGALAFYPNGATTPLVIMDDDSEKVIVGLDVTDNLNIINSQNYDHPTFASSQVMGTGGSPFIIASHEGDSESAGIHGDGNAMTIWNPGDGVSAAGVSAYLYVLDEDRWSDDDNPYNGTALIAYLNTSGNWQVSDRKRKSNIKRYSNAIDQVKRMNAYSYEYILTEEEKAKSNIPINAVGLMAQEIEKIIPEAVNRTTNGDYFLNYSMITPVLAEALKEQQNLIESLQSEMATMRDQATLIRALEERIAALEQE